MQQPDRAQAQGGPAPSLRPEPPLRGRGLLLILLTVAVIAVAIRAVFFAELLHNLPFYRATHEGFDQDIYNLWAQKIIAGDLLSRSQGVFFFSPLYPYVLALAYRVAGSGNVVAGIVANGLFGVAAAVIAAALGARLFGKWGGLAAGLLMALNGSQLSVEAMLLGDSLVPAVCLAALLLIVANLDKDAAALPAPLWSWLPPGLLFGAASVGRATNLLVAAALCALVAVPVLTRRRWRCLAAAGVMGVGVWLIAGLPVLRNGLMFGRWTTTLNGPVTLYVGNAPGATGVFVHPPGFAEAYKRLGETNHPASRWFGQLRQELRQHPGALRGVLARKTLVFLNSWDAPDNGNYYFVRRYTLSAKTLTFGPLFLYVVGFLGVALTARQWRALLPLYVFAASFALSLILTLVSGRYKLPFLALLAVLGGGAAAAIGQRLRARRFGLPVASAVLAGILVVAFWPRNSIALGRPWTLFRPGEFLNNAALLVREGRKADALDLLEDGYAVFPGLPEFTERLAYLYLEAGEPRRAAELTESALASGVVSQRILERRLLAYRAMSLADRASLAARDLAEHYPDSPLLKPSGASRANAPPGF